MLKEKFSLAKFGLVVRLNLSIKYYLPPSNLSWKHVFKFDTLQTINTALTPQVLEEQ